MKPIITISREFGSGGRLIGKMLADVLGYTYYDKNILKTIAEEHGYSVEMIEADEKKAKSGWLYSLQNAFGAAGYGLDSLSINEKFFIAQFDYITELAKSGQGGVIVGRCADYVLRDFDNVVNVFVYSDRESKLERTIKNYGVPKDKAEQLMDDTDKARENYYRYHTGQKWGELKNYDIAIDSKKLSIDAYVRVLIKYLEEQHLI